MSLSPTFGTMKNNGPAASATRQPGSGDESSGAPDGDRASTPVNEGSIPSGSAIQTTCIEHAYGSTFRLSFQIKVF